MAAKRRLSHYVKSNQRNFATMHLAEGEELETNVLQVVPRNRAKSHATQRTTLFSSGPVQDTFAHTLFSVEPLVASVIHRPILPAPASLPPGAAGWRYDETARDTGRSAM